MEKSVGESEKTVIISVPVTLTDSDFDRVVVTEIEQDPCLTTKETLCSHQNTAAEHVTSACNDTHGANCKQSDKNIDGNESNCVISEANQALRSTESLQGSMETYQEMSSVNATISRIVVQGDSDLNENRHDVLSSQAESHLQKESGNVYGTISTLTTTQGSVHASSATYLTLDSLCQLQSLPNHALLNTAELSNGLIDAGTHFVINTPQIQSINALNQHGNSQVVLVQVPTSQTTNHLLGPHVSSSNIQTTVGVVPSSIQVSNARSTETLEVKKARGKGASKGKAKRIKQENHNTMLRPLAPRVVAVPMSSPLVIAASATTPQVYSSVTPMDQLQQLTAMPSNQISRTTGQHFEVLGRCIVCFRFCRTTTYCRAEKNHTDVRAAACAECEAKGCSTVVCRRKHQHKGQNAYPPNIVINTAIPRAVDLKEMCIKNLLPPCFSDLHSLTVHHADCIFSQPRVKNDSEDQLLTIDGVPNGEQTQYRKPTDYARGYLYPYAKEAWEQWLAKFCAQTGTSYRIRTGKRVNKKSDHGLANHNGKIVVYRVLESQLHNCALGGRPRKKAVREGSKRRKSRGSKLIGCSAVIHTRLIVTEENWKALEITVPKLSAHLPVHDPRITNTEISNDVNSMILSDSLYDSEQGVPNHAQDDYAIIEDVGFHNETEAELTNDQMQFISTMHIDNLKKQTRNLMSACGNLLDDVSNLETLKTIHLHVQTLYNELLPVTTQKRNRKRNADEASLIHAEEVLEEGETRSDSVGQVVLLQAD